MTPSILLFLIAFFNLVLGAYFQLLVGDTASATMHYAIAAVMMSAANLDDEK
tara:strand:+ start:50 stop:205 length:156 start_codon:yes stop_codon:yes gene_type:complete